MILTYLNTTFIREGASSKKELLSSDNSIIYKSDSLITSMSYAGKGIKIIRSTSIPACFTNILKNIKGYVSLGTTKTSSGVAYKNAHIYSSKATSLDGVERICYIQAVDFDTLCVSEYNGNRGSAYSSLFLILKSKLLNNGFVQNLPDDNFSITKIDVQKFVDLINELISEHDNGMYDLVREEDKIDTITLGKAPEQRKLFYFIAYWREKELKERDISNKDGVEVVIDILNSAMRKIETLNKRQEIETVIKKLDETIRFSNAKKTLIEIKESL